MDTCLLAAEGERTDLLSGTLLLGDGYRAYTPVLQRFHSPDNESPFGSGGVNTYAYCSGDPVNRSDPSGHYSVMGWVGLGLSVGFGVIFAPVSGGTTLAAALSVASVAAGLVSAGLAVAPQFIQGLTPAARTALSWAALGAGIVSGLAGAGFTLLPGITATMTGRVEVTRLGGLMMSSEAATALSGGQFRHARFLGVYPSVEEPGHLLTFVFQDEYQGHSRLTMVGQPAVTCKQSFGVGSGKWMDGRYVRQVLGYKKVSRHIRNIVEQYQDIKHIRLAIPYAGKAWSRSRISFTVRLRSHIADTFPATDITFSGPTESFELKGEVVDKLSELQNSLHLNDRQQLVTYNNNPFSPEFAQCLMDHLSQEYGEREGAFDVIGGMWR